MSLLQYLGPEARTAASAQLRLLLRREGGSLIVIFLIAAVQGVAMAAFGVVLGITISTGDTETHVGFSRLLEFQQFFRVGVDRGVVGLIAVWIVCSISALFWPYGVWSGETPSNRGYHWSLPVERSLHDLMRVWAGGLLLLAVTTVAALAALAAAALAGNTAGLAQISGWIWPAWLLGPLVPYLLVSIFTVRFDVSGGWFWGGIGVLATVTTALTAAGWDAPGRLLGTLLIGELGLVQAVGGPVLALWKKAPFEARADWLIAWLVWVALFKLLLFVAARAPRR